MNNLTNPLFEHGYKRKNIGNEEIYQILKQKILNLELYPGQKISENEISSQYNISRTPVKTAFLRLMSEGFIEIIPQKGTYVALLDLRYIRDIIFSRYILEREILIQAMDMSTDEYIQTLNDNIQQQKIIIDTVPIQTAEFFKLDTMFHRYSFEWTQHFGIWEMIQSRQVHYQRFRLLDIVTMQRFREIYDDHIILLNCIQSKDCTTLSTTLKAHLDENLMRLADITQSKYKEYFVST